MFCESYKQPLSDSAASGELNARLQEHLARCASCHAAFTEERSLYATIDASVRVAANAQVPATLIPRVHVALNDESIREKTSRIWLYAVALLVAASVVAFAYLHPRGTPYPLATRPNSSSRTISTIATAPDAVNTLTPRGVNRGQRDGAATPARRHTSDADVVEVIVEPEEAAALLRYEALLRERSAPKSQTLVARTIELQQGIEPLKIADLELGDLRIPALEKTEADGDGK